MWRERFIQAVTRLREAATDAAWRQWCAVSSLPPPSGSGRASSVIDPEALVLASLALRDRERRLWDVLVWWAGTGARLLSVQRMKRLLREYRSEDERRLREFALQAMWRGDRRWGSLVGRAVREVREAAPIAREKSFGPRSRLVEPAALLFRLRAAFGVGARSDLLAFLISMRGTGCPIRRIAEATYYTARTLSAAADEMALARIIHASGGRPVEYHVRPGAWVDLLELGEPPPWRYWGSLYAFVCRVDAWVAAADFDTATDYLLSTRARDLALEHRDTFARNRIFVPRPEDHPGEQYLDAFITTLEKTGDWLRASV
jgi:hypothetical protein